MSRRPLHLFVLIDALGWRFLEDRKFLSDILTYRMPLRTVLGFSSGAIPTILTGVPPAQNGHWNLFYYDPEGSPFRWLRYFQFLPDRILDHRVTRKLMKEMGRHLLGMGPLFECLVSPRLLRWFSYVEKRNIYDRGGIAGARSVFDQMAERGVPYKVYTYHHWTDSEILQRARKDLETSDASFYFIYLSEMDMFLHTHCRDKAKIAEKLAWYDRELRDLFAFAQKLDPQAHFALFSDHGMTPVEHHFDLVGQVEKLGYQMPGDYLAVYDSTMARFWFRSDAARRDITNHLGGLSCGRILSDAELQQFGVFFSDRRYGELIFLMNPRWLLSRNNFNGRGWMPAGMHGYHPEDSYSDAVFLTNRQPPVPMRTIAEIYPIMRDAAFAETDAALAGTHKR